MKERRIYYGLTVIAFLMIGVLLIGCNNDDSPELKPGAVVEFNEDLTVITPVSITVTASVLGTSGQQVEYSFNEEDLGPLVWQDSGTFTGLTANTFYFFYARSKGNSTHKAGKVSMLELKTTVKAAGALANKPELVQGSKSETSITVTATLQTNTGQTVQYARNDVNLAPTTNSSWHDSGVFSGLEPDSTYYFFARSKENDTHQTGVSSEGLQEKTESEDDPAKEDGAAANQPTLVSVSANSVTVTATLINNTGVQGIQFARGDSSTGPTSGWQDSGTFNGLNPNTTYYFYARSNGNTTHNHGDPSEGLAVLTLPEGISGSTFSVLMDVELNNLDTLAGIELSKSSVNNTFTIQMSVLRTAFESIIVYLNNVNVFDSKADNGDYIIDAGTLDIGTHSLTLEVKMAGNALPYAKAVTFRVIR